MHACWQLTGVATSWRRDNTFTVQDFDIAMGKEDSAWKADKGYIYARKTRRGEPSLRWNRYAGIELVDFSATPGCLEFCTKVVLDHLVAVAQLKVMVKFHKLLRSSPFES